MTELVGIVTTGLGDCGQWIALHRAAYARKTGLQLFPGTLNLRLGVPFELPEGSLRLEAAEYGGRVNVSIVPCRVRGLPAVILRTDANEDGSGPHPREIIEVAAEVGLRETFALSDGDELTVHIPLPG
ncbi:MAG: DUF120 domain-containing protein [Planctomycetota bacterium]|nr:DUF120 domain-containing protein [Planctomycetota bacterium]